MRIGLTDYFHTSGSDVRMDEETQRRNLLLCLYALGTNAGYKRMGGVSSDALRHMRRRLCHETEPAGGDRSCGQRDTSPSARHTFGARRRLHVLPTRKKFAAWAPKPAYRVAHPLPWPRHHGLLAYRQEGSLYPFTGQTLSSSEVAAMIEGVLHHCTEMSVDKITSIPTARAALLLPLSSARL